MKISNLNNNRLFPRLLAEAEDRELKNIVEKAAKDLGTPIAMVNLMLDHIQFFRAHYGLPEDLKIAGSTNKDVSFCQFVVNKGNIFEVNDAENDNRIPKHLVREYGIKSYLGMPIRARHEIIGSLCVIDTVPRKFTTKEQESLLKLSEIVNKRFEEILIDKEKSRPSLIERNATYAIEELRGAIKPLSEGVNNGFSFLKSISSFIKLSEHQLNGNSVSSSSLRSLLNAAKKSIIELENDLYNLDAAAGDISDSVKALDNLLIESEATYLVDVAESGRELSRHLTKEIGGVFLPDIETNPRLSISKSTGIALVSNCLLHMAIILSEKENYSDGIKMNISDLEHEACISIQASGFSNSNSKNLLKTLNSLTINNPSIETVKIPDGVELRFSILRK
ncbi:GAF domain-containing protein [Mangrovivirga sp. M17]|uniref:GAF domain-containing protein n=1 Tax=Mangrovivirga halotolerans TaxID=2993936 RepID=A0ABT3RQM1_9BACT|nr:GAF domain-containing protein [Mangrovivirga halotolerans]MCX2743926.1 GAF domain-containing protein [Mangrovivirga halotolerans]